MKQPDEIAVDEAFVARLIEEQVPQWSDLSLRRIPSSGTDNAIFRLGDHLSVRVPRRPAAIALLSKELEWLPQLNGLPLATPFLRYRGHTEHGFDFGIFDWMEGENAVPEHIADWQSAARDLADFLKALHLISRSGAPQAGAVNNRRGIAIGGLTDVTIPAIHAVSDEIDVAQATALWQSACETEFHKPPVWLHGDLKADNLIAKEGQLVGVIDWGLSAVGDPAADYAAAWSWIAPEARSAFLDRLDLDHSDRTRAKGWALYGAVIALSYYRNGKNEALCRQSRLTLSRLKLLL